MLRMRTSHNELESLEFLEHGVHALWRYECPTSEVGIREPGLFIQTGEDGKLGHREIVRLESIGHCLVQGHLCPLYQVAHPGHRHLVHAHSTISLPDTISGYLIQST